MTHDDVVSAIRTRRSVRSYRREALSPEDQSFVHALVQELSATPGPCSTRVRMVFSGAGSGAGGAHSGNEDAHRVDAAASDATDLLQGKVGTYGVIRGAGSYVGAVVENTPESMLDLGYIFERLVIELTARGLGTCWLGGTFDRKGFAAAAGLAPGEILPIITPVGYAADRAGLQDRFMRTMAGSDRRKPFEQLFFTGSFNTPLNAQHAGVPWAEVLELVRIGPSASNKQPWRVVLGPATAERPSAAHLYLARTPGYIGNKLGFDIQRVDIGIAMFHLESALRAAGFGGRWDFSTAGFGSGLSLPAPPDEHTEYVATLTIN